MDPEPREHNTRVDHYNGDHNEEPGLEPFEGWASSWDTDDVTVQTWNYV